MTISISRTTFDYSGRTWNLMVSQKLTHHKAKSDVKVVEENHGSLSHAICAMGSRMAQYGIESSEHLSAYKALRIAYKNALASFSQTVDFDKNDGKEFSVPSSAIADASYICLPDRHSIAVHYEQTTDHGKSNSGINVKCSYPGTVHQACEKILNLEVGEIMLTKENASVFDLIDTINLVAKRIVSAVEKASPSEDTKARLSMFRTCSARNIRQKNASLEMAA